ncbi:hypothetical protein QTO34_008980 [Cnephaeus nilssonii]|uniref:Uncharacterized protein n=1 Tax=Cnephaeus nilssonii TaxID=3371016 RepID=A0AA40LGU7_CNENI|nr:hypothetical protein QTO34_008980 [Eptesicus nilssonii]
MSTGCLLQLIQSCDQTCLWLAIELSPFSFGDQGWVFAGVVRPELISSPGQKRAQRQLGDPSEEALAGVPSGA